MADRKDKINEQQVEQEIREEIREEMKHADQEPAQEQYSLNDDRRVKVLSPGMLVAKRFIRNRMAVTGLVILVFMFVFSFIGGLISPYGQDQFFYTDKTIRRDSARPRKTPSSSTPATTTRCSASPPRPELCWPSSRGRPPSPTRATTSP